MRQNKKIYELNQLTSSISGFNEEDDFNYFIDTTQNIQFSTKQPDTLLLNYSSDNNNKSNKSLQNYISKLEKIVIL